MQTETKYRKGALVKSLRMFVEHYKAGYEFWLYEGLSSSTGCKIDRIRYKSFAEIVDWIDDGFLFLAVPYEAKSATPDAVVEEKGDGRRKDLCPVCGRQGHNLGNGSFACDLGHDWKSGESDAPKSVTPATTFKPVTMIAPPPCAQACPKCGSLDVCREMIEKGRRLYPPRVPGDFPYKNTEKQIYDHEAIRHFCRCCKYEWDSNPLDAEEPQP